MKKLKTLKSRYIKEVRGKGLLIGVSSIPSRRAAVSAKP